MGILAILTSFSLSLVGSGTSAWMSYRRGELIEPDVPIEVIRVESERVVVVRRLRGATEEE